MNFKIFNTAKWKLLVTVVFTAFLFEINAQNYPQNYFRYPLDSLPSLVSPFGGLRDNHFHSGMDLRTNQREGLPVFASADGYVSRIKIQSIGYGKAIYLDHPNGYTTVYGHLQKYSGKIAEWIQNYQYKNQSFEFDYVFEKPVLLVKKGDTIGLSGNSGGSSGPHVHFEIRNTKSEKIINPALFGIIPFDTLNSTIKKVFVYTFVPDGLLLKQELKINNQTITTTNLPNQFIYKKALELPAEMYGFGIEAYDYIHNLTDEKGIYEYSLKSKNKLAFSHTLNQFAFDESKYINAHIDYPFYKIAKTQVQKCFIDDGNEFSTYQTNALKGKILVTKKTRDTLVFEIKDFNQNKFILLVPIVGLSSKIDKEKQEYLKSVKGKKAFYPLKKNTVKIDGFLFELDSKSIYDTVFYDIFSIKQLQPATNSKIYKVYNPSATIHKAASIAIKPSSSALKFKNKLLLAYYFKDRKDFRSAGGNYDGGVVKGKVSNFGYYFVTMDTIAPTIKQIFINTEEALGDSLHFYFEIKDNFSGIGKYEGYLNGKWILLDFDAKSNILTYHFDKIWYNLVAQNKDSKLKNTAIIKPEVLIRVTDKKGNVAEKSFIMPIALE
ncbi:MAG: M23 family metallopeptidase [Candidatus Methylacidiphilales bacterium]